MTRIVLYEKPGCVSNRRQRVLLEELGYRLAARDLLREPWSHARLASSIGDRSLAEWLNASAPRVEPGELVSEFLDTDRAIREMTADPLLVRRPLIETPHGRFAGLDPHPALERLGIAGASGSALDSCAGASGSALDSCAGASGSVLDSCARASSRPVFAEGAWR